MTSSPNPDSDDYDNGRLSDRVGSPMPDGVLLLNRQRTERADWGEVRRFLRQLASTIRTPGFTVCLLSDAAIRRYNRQFRGLDQATDVLSFPSGEGGNEEAQYLGDILISTQTARNNARRFGVRFEEEIELLALHGVLHLLGHDHEQDHGEMARLERDWSRRLGLPQSLTERSRSRSTKRNGRRRVSP